jgi:hypothetical protein
MASKNEGGYGSFWLNPKMRYAHRVSAFWAGIISDLDDGSVVCHSCDNPSCVNPDHLWRGTQKQNLQDMVLKGRKVTPCQEGEGNHNSKLTEDDVRYIKAFLAAGAQQKLIAKQFGVSYSAVQAIKKDRRWGHVEVTRAPKGAATGAVLSGKPKAPRQEGF